MDGIIGKFNEERDKIGNSSDLLSSFPVNRTVGFLQEKKESCSTWQGQRMGTGFREFQQTP